MIALDTNVLLRIIVADDQSQHQIALKTLQEFEANDETFLINDVVLSEFAWTLKTAYRYERSEIAFTLQTLLDIEAYQFENRTTVTNALKLFQHSSADFPDCLIVAKNNALGCQQTITFDKAMRHLPDVNLLS